MDLDPDHDPEHPDDDWGDPRGSQRTPAAAAIGAERNASVLASLIFDEEDPAYHGRRFTAAVYRVVRAILSVRADLEPGQSLVEAVQVSVSKDIFDSPGEISQSSIFEAVSEISRGLPVLPNKDLSDEQVERLSTVYGFVAIRLGFEPDDPCLHWLHPSLFRDWMPTAAELLQFDAELVRATGHVLVASGRASAFLTLSSILGQPSIYERKDWSSLSMAYIRDFTSKSTEDDRTLMISRLERLASKARASLDVRAETAILRTIAQIQGLTAVDDKKQQRELMLMLANRERKRSRELAAPAPLPRLGVSQ